MNKGFLALGLALSLLPVAALADDTVPSGPPPSPPTAAQRQAIMKTFESFAQQEHQLREQLRAQVLASLTPAHKAAVANLIGQLAISPNPDPAVTAKQLDVLLSAGEQQHILALHSSFKSHVKALHDQMRAQIQSELPAAMQQRFSQKHQETQMVERSEHPNDAGSLLLAALSPHGDRMIMKMGDDHMGHGFMMMHDGGDAPPPQ